MMPNLYQFNFDLRQLRTFLTIAQTLNFRQAAEILHIAQPALSRQIAQLEQALDCQLFNRQKRQISLTDAGQHLFESLPSLFEQLNIITNRTQAIANGQFINIKLGFSSAAMSSFLPSIIKQLHQQLEQCEFEFKEATSDELIQAVLDKQLDAAFILHRPEHPLLNTLAIKADRTGIILPDNHPLLAKTILEAGDLKGQTLIVFPRHTNPSMYDDIINYCQQAGFHPQHIIETAPRSTAIGLVAAGQGIATIAESLKHNCVNGTVYRPLAMPCPMINYSCITRVEVSAPWLAVIQQAINKLAN